METGIRIGSEAPTGGVASDMADALVKLLNSNAEQETICKALDVFGQVVKVENITISDVNIDGRTINVE